MLKPEYRAVIIGLSGIGARRPEEDEHLPVYGPMPGSHAGAYDRHPQTEVVAVCDLREEALADFKSQWGDVWPDVRLYTDYRELLQAEKPDLVSVATSDHVHADMTVAAAESGARAILCEKPIATSLEDADRMIAAAEANGVLLSIEHTRRWNASYLKAREIIRSGEIGPLRTIVCEQFSRRAMLFRNGTHLLDMICFYAEANPWWLVSELEEGFEHFTEYKGDGGKDPAVDPYASAYIRFDNGVRSFYNAYKVDFPGSRFALTCEDGTHRDFRPGRIPDPGQVAFRVVCVAHIVREICDGKSNRGRGGTDPDSGGGRRSGLACTGGAQDGGDHDGDPEVAPRRELPGRFPHVVRGGAAPAGSIVGHSPFRKGLSKGIRVSAVRSYGYRLRGCV